MSDRWLPVVLILFLMSTSARLPADDGWSRFRGPNGSGVCDDVRLPAQFDLTDGLRWKTPLPPGHSSPVLRNGRIFLTAADGQQLLTLCIDQQSGKLLWRAPAPRPRKEKLDPRNHPAAPSAAADQQSVYVFFGDFGLLCYSHEGELRWQMPLGPFHNLYGMGASPLVVDDLLILVCDQNRGSYLLGVDKNSGEIAWKVDRPEATSGHCSPIVHRAPEGAHILVPGSFFLTAYAAATGEKRWWVGGLCFEMKSTPVMSSDTVYINGYGSPANQPGEEINVPDFAAALASQDSNGDGLVAGDELTDQFAKGFFPALDLDGSGALDASEWSYFRAAMASKNSMMAIGLGGSGDMTTHNVRWKYHRNIPQLPSPLLYNGRLFMISDQGIVTCFDPATGEALGRGRLAGAPGNIYASPVAADGKLYFVTEAGRIAAMRGDESLQVLGVTDLGERCYATPAIDRSGIYVRSQQALYAFAPAATVPARQQR